MNFGCYVDRKINTERDPKLELLSSLIKPEHPGSKLVRKTADAQRNVTDNKLTKKLITFKERHYSAHRMTVTIRVSTKFWIFVIESYVESVIHEKQSFVKKEERPESLNFLRFDTSNLFK